MFSRGGGTRLIFCLISTSPSDSRLASLSALYSLAPLGPSLCITYIAHKHPFSPPLPRTRVNFLNYNRSFSVYQTRYTHTHTHTQLLLVLCFSFTSSFSSSYSSFFLLCTCKGYLGLSLFSLRAPTLRTNSTFLYPAPRTCLRAFLFHYLLSKLTTAAMLFRMYIYYGLIFFKRPRSLLISFFTPRAMSDYKTFGLSSKYSSFDVNITIKCKQIFIRSGYS